MIRGGDILNRTGDYNVYYHYNIQTDENGNKGHIYPRSCATIELPHSVPPGNKYRVRKIYVVNNLSIVVSSLF